LNIGEFKITYKRVPGPDDEGTAWLRKKTPQMRNLMTQAH
jgi:hypothetical protein